MQTHSITLGMNIPNAGKVTNQMWIQFLNDTVLASLEYATITDAIGIYKGELEKSKVISVTTDSPAAVDALLTVGDAYKKAFNQECILYTVAPVPQLTFKWSPSVKRYVSSLSLSPRCLISDPAGILRIVTDSRNV